MNITRRLLTIVILVSGATLGLAGCAASGSGGSESSSVDEAPAQAQSAADEAEPDAAVVITGRISIETDDPIDAARTATGIVTDAGGRVSARSESAAEEGRAASAELTLRVPADSVEQVRGELASLGVVKETTFESAEVGGVQRDLEARTVTLRASIARYTEWLGSASKTADLIELESAIADRQTELEGLEAQTRTLEDQVSMSTITLNLSSEYVPVETAPANFGEALLVGWNGFVAAGSAALIALGVSLPWLVLLGVITATTILLIVRNRRKRDALPQPVAPTLDATLFPGADELQGKSS